MSTPSLPARARERRLAERSRSGRLIRESICLLSSKWAVDVLLALGDGIAPPTIILDNGSVESVIDLVPH